MFKSIAYAPSKLEKLLGKNYKWWYFVKYSFERHNGGAWSLGIAQFSLLSNSLISSYAWVFAGAGSDIFTYLLFGKVFRGLTESYNYGELSEQIYNGKITSDLIKPVDFFWSRFFKTIGERLVHNSINTTTYILASIIAFSTFAKFQPTVLNNLLILILFIPLAFYIWFIAGEIIGMLAFFFGDSRAYARTVQSYNAMLGIMVSNFIPLDKLPFSQFWTSTPFAFAVHHPMQIYLGNYTPAQTGWALLGGIVEASPACQGSILPNLMHSGVYLAIVKNKQFKM